MLYLTALEARFRNLSLFGCKAVGGKVLLFYREERKDQKKPSKWLEIRKNQKDRD